MKTNINETTVSSMKNFEFILKLLLRSKSCFAEKTLESFDVHNKTSLHEFFLVLYLENTF